MATQDSPNSTNRSIQVSGNVTGGSALVTGDQDVVIVSTKNFQQAKLPEPKTVDIRAEIQVLMTILASFNDPFANAAIQILVQEVAKPEPDKRTIAKALEMGFGSVKGMADFGDAVHKRRPNLKATVGWLGKHGHKLLPMVGWVL